MREREILEEAEIIQAIKKGMESFERGEGKPAKDDLTSPEVEEKQLSDEETAAQIKKSLRGRVFSDSAVLLREDRSRAEADESLTKTLLNSPLKDSEIDLTRSKDGLGRIALQFDKEAEDAEEKELVAAGLMRLPKEEKNEEFLNMPAPPVKKEVIQKVIREERDEDSKR